MRINPLPYPSEDLTEDALFDGRIILQQPRKGYRFSVDSPLLTWFATESGEADLGVDLGSGCGAVGIGLLATRALRRLIAVELQDGLAALSQHNAIANGFDAQYQLVHGDMRASHTLLEPGTFDRVVSNPPFWPADSGRLPIQEERRIACHEIAIDLDGIVSTACRLLHPRRGRLCIIFPARRLEYLMATLLRFHLNATRVVFVHPHTQDTAGWVLLEARHGHSEHLAVMPPLILKTCAGEDTEEGRTVLTGTFSAYLMSMADQRRPRRD